MSGVPHPPNAFTARFLSRLGERDEPPTAGEAAVAGPWRIEPLPGKGFGLFRPGRSLARGHRPAAICPSRWAALVLAAMLPGTGRDPMLRLGKDADGEGMYPVILDTGEVVARLDVFDDTLIERVNTLIHLLQSPLSCHWRLAATQQRPAQSRRFHSERRRFAEGKGLKATLENS